MIKSTRIKNYQSHKDSKLEFAKGVNVIIGSSDSGKSTIVRAMNWDFHNKPSGDSFRSDWGGDTEVNIEFDNGNVSRKKTDKENLYILNKEEYKSFKTDVPEEIKKIMNMDDINIHFQMDPSFLLSSTSGEVSRYLNQISNLDIIDISLANIAKMRTKTKSHLNNKEDLLKEYMEEIEQYQEIDSLNQELLRIEEKSDSFSIVDREIKNIKKIVDAYEEISRELDEFEDVSISESALFLMENDINKFSELSNKIKGLEKIISSFMEFNSLLQKCHIQIENMEKEYKSSMPNICPLCNQEIKNDKV